MSEKIIELANTGLEELKSSKVKYFDWRIRREIYKILNAKAVSTSSPQHKHLAIQSAEFVMPFFTLVNKDDPLAFKLLECAKALAENHVMDIQELDEIQENGYYNQWFGYNYETKQRNFQSAYAGDSIYRALIEVRYMIDPWEGARPLANTMDDNWVLGPFGDTAVVASFAYSTSPTSDECQPKLLYEFWEWWVKVALPNSLKIKSA